MSIDDILECAKKLKQVGRNPIPSNVPVYKSDFLPYDEYFMACNIVTKSEFNYYTGSKVHGLVVNGNLLLSIEAYEALEQYIPSKKQLSWA